MKYLWKDLSGRMNCFTVRSATMIDLRTNKPVRYYSANTRITVVQKCNTDKGVFYRTEYAKEQGLDWAFKASAFGLPDEKAPSVPSDSPLSKSKPVNSHTKTGTKNKKSAERKASSNDGGTRLKRIFGKLIRRKNG